MQASENPTRSGTGLLYKWIVAFTVVFGIFMSILDSTVVNIAIPRLQSAFGASLDDVQWVLSGYTLALGVATPLTGYLAEAKVVPSKPKVVPSCPGIMPLYPVCLS